MALLVGKGMIILVGGALDLLRRNTIGKASLQFERILDVRTRQLRRDKS